MLTPATRRKPGPLLLLIALMALATAGLCAGPARAADGDVTWTVRTAANGYGDDRSSYSYTVNPGGEIKDAMVVANRSESPLELTVYAADGFTTDTGQLDLLTGDKKSLGVGAWAHAARDSLVIKPGKSAEVPFTVRVPANATPGDYVGGVLTSLKQADDAEGINVDRRLGIRVKLRVSGELKPKLSIENLDVDYAGSLNPFAKGDATVTYTIHNTGNALLSARQSVSVAGPFGWLRAKAGDIAAPPELLPGESWKVKVPVHGVTPGVTLSATATLTPAHGRSGLHHGTEADRVDGSRLGRPVDAAAVDHPPDRCGRRLVPPPPPHPHPPQGPRGRPRPGRGGAGAAREGADVVGSCRSCRARDPWHARSPWRQTQVWFARCCLVWTRVRRRHPRRRAALTGKPTPPGHRLEPNHQKDDSGGGRFDLPAKTMTWSMRPRRRWTTSVPARRGPPSGVVKTHWYRAHSSGMSTAEQRTIVPVPAGWRRMSSTNRSTAATPSLRPNGPQKTTSEVRAWESRAVT